MFQLFARPRAPAIAAGLSVMLLTPFAGRAEEPSLAPAGTALPRVEHIMGSGGLGSRLEETVIVCLPPALSAGQHLMGSGGLGSRVEETLVPNTSGSC